MSVHGNPQQAHSKQINSCSGRIISPVFISWCFHIDKDGAYRLTIAAMTTRWVTAHAAEEMASKLNGGIMLRDGIITHVRIIVMILYV